MDVFSVDIPEPIIWPSVTGDYNVGSNLSVLCTIDIIDNLVNVSVNSSIVKVEESSRVTLVDNTLSDNITLYLLYAPLKASHSGMYECQVMLVQSSINYEAVYKCTFNVNVTSKCIMHVISDQVVTVLYKLSYCLNSFFSL